MKTKILSSIILGMFFISLVGALGVSSPYWGDNPLQMYKGETRVVDLNLQNMVGEDDVTFKAEITEGAEIASLDEDTYTVEIGTFDTIVPLTVTLPDDYDEGRIQVEFKTVSADEGGTVSLGTGMVVSFQVLSFKKPGLSTTAWVIIVAIIALIATILIRRNNK